MPLAAIAKRFSLGAVVTLLGAAAGRAQDDVPADPIGDINSEPPADPGQGGNRKILVAWPGDEWDLPATDTAYLWTIEVSPKGLDPRPLLAAGNQRIYDPSAFTSRSRQGNETVYFTGRLTEPDGAGPYFLWSYGGGEPQRIEANGAPLEVGAELVAIGGLLHFAGTDGEGVEPWHYDTATQTATRTDNLNPGAANSHPELLTKVADDLYFVAESGAGKQLYRLVPNGTPAPIAGFDAFEELESAGAQGLFFSAGPSAGLRVYWTNGAAPVEVEDFQNPYTGPRDLMFLDAGDDSRLFFLAGTANRYLWAVHPDALDGARRLTSQGDDPRSPCILNDTLYFVARGSAGGSNRTIWLWHEPQVGVRELISGEGDIDSLSATGQHLFAVAAGDTELLTLGRRGLELLGGFTGITDPDPTGDELFFVDADPAHALRRLWISAGTADTTRPVMRSADSDPGGFVEFEGAQGRVLIFAADGVVGDNQGRRVVHGREPWTSDGTRAGTKELKDIATAGNGSESSNPEQFTVAGDRVYFVATYDEAGTKRELWHTDGTTAGTMQTGGLPTALAALGGLTPMGNRVVFPVREANANSTLLYAAKDAATLLKYGSTPAPLQEASNLTPVTHGPAHYVFFTATQAGQPRRGFVTNGTKTLGLGSGLDWGEGTEFAHLQDKAIVVFAARRAWRGIEPFKVSLTKLAELFAQ